MRRLCEARAVISHVARRIGVVPAGEEGGREGRKRRGSAVCHLGHLWLFFQPGLLFRPIVTEATARPLSQSPSSPLGGKIWPNIFFLSAPLPSPSLSRPLSRGPPLPDSPPPDRPPQGWPSGSGSRQPERAFTCTFEGPGASNTTKIQ